MHYTVASYKLMCWQLHQWSRWSSIDVASVCHFEGPYKNVKWQTEFHSTVWHQVFRIAFNGTFCLYIVIRDQPRGLVVGVSDYWSWGPEFDSRLYHGDFSLKRISSNRGLRCVAVGWGTALQAGRSRVRFPMLSLEILITRSFRPCMTLRSTQALTDISTRNIFWWVKAAGA
jgi:hypothetical protein